MGAFSTLLSTVRDYEKPFQKGTSVMIATDLDSKGNAIHRFAGENREAIELPIIVQQTLQEVAGQLTRALSGLEQYTMTPVDEQTTRRYIETKLRTVIRTDYGTIEPRSIEYNGKKVEI